MNYYNSDFVTNSSSSNYIAVLKKKKQKETTKDYLCKALGIKKGSSLEKVATHIESEMDHIFGRYTPYNMQNYKTEFIKDYGEEVGKELIKLIESNEDVYYIRVSDDGGDEPIQQLIMYEESNVNNKYILFVRRVYGY